MESQKNAILSEIESLLVRSRLTKYELATKLLKGQIPKATLYDYLSGRHDLLTGRASIILTALRQYVEALDRPRQNESQKPLA